MVSASPWHSSAILAHCDVPVDHDRALPVSPECCDCSSPKHELPFPDGDGPGMVVRGTGLPQKWVALISQCLFPGPLARCEEQQANGQFMPLQ